LFAEFRRAYADTQNAANPTGHFRPCLAERGESELCRFLVEPQHLVPHYIAAFAPAGDVAALMEVRSEPCLYTVKPVLNLQVATLPQHRKRHLATRMYYAALREFGATCVQAAVRRDDAVDALVETLGLDYHSPWCRVERMYPDTIDGLRAFDDLFAGRTEETPDGQLVGLRLGPNQQYRLGRARPRHLTGVAGFRCGLARELGYPAAIEPIEAATENLIEQPDELSASQLYAVTDELDRVVGTARVTPFFNPGRMCFEASVRDVVLAPGCRGQHLLRWLIPGLVFLTRTVLHGPVRASWHRRAWLPILNSTWVPGRKLADHYLRELAGYSRTPETFAETSLPRHPRRALRLAN
jgi:hypothetical protein